MIEKIKKSELNSFGFVHATKRGGLIIDQQQQRIGILSLIETDVFSVNWIGRTEILNVRTEFYSPESLQSNASGVGLTGGARKLGNDIAQGIENHSAKSRAGLVLSVQSIETPEHLINIIDDTEIKQAFEASRQFLESGKLNSQFIRIADNLRHAGYEREVATQKIGNMISSIGATEQEPLFVKLKNSNPKLFYALTILIVILCAIFLFLLSI